MFRLGLVGTVDNPSLVVQVAEASGGNPLAGQPPILSPLTTCHRWGSLTSALPGGAAGAGGMLASTGGDGGMLPSAGELVDGPSAGGELVGGQGAKDGIRVPVLAATPGTETLAAVDSPAVQLEVGDDWPHPCSRCGKRDGQSPIPSVLVLGR